MKKIVILLTMIVSTGCVAKTGVSADVPYNAPTPPQQISQVTAVPIDSNTNSKVCKAKVAPGPRKVGNPYQIYGVTYYPVSTADGYEEEGVASWYGPGFHSKLTANGETYNQHDMTAAHRTLPMPTFVVVENLENGKSVVVRINDRGPFAKNRIIDLSEKAAIALDMTQKGTANVRVSVLSEDPDCVVVKGTEVNIDKGNFAVQIGAFANPNNAERLSNRFGNRGDISTSYIDGALLHRVWVTGYTSRIEAKNAADELSSEFAGAFVIAR